MELGAHLPLMEFGDEGHSLDRVMGTVDAARECWFAAVSANDHFVFSTPWLDGPTALAAAVERSGDMIMGTSTALAILRGPVPLAKTLAALDVLSDGRVIAAVGPGSSARDYDAIGIPFEERWKHFDEAVAVLRGEPAPPDTRFYPLPDAELEPRPRQNGGVPLWIGSWGSEAGLRRVARLADGWLASAYNTTPELFGRAWQALGTQLADHGRASDTFPNALATMWCYITEDPAEAERVLIERVVPTVHRPEDMLRERLPIGPPELFAEKLTAFAKAGVQRVYIWPVA